MATIALHKEPDCSYVAVPLTFLTNHMPQANGEFVKVYLCLLQAFHRQTPLYPQKFWQIVYPVQKVTSYVHCITGNQKIFSL